jgi:crossover junction endodeoxyribonuclease RusA
MFSLFVAGNPAPQGSKRHVGGGVLVDSCKRLPDWRKDVRTACLDAEGQPKARFEGAVSLHLDFVLPRPKSLPKRRTPPATKKPDWEKLARAVGDAMTSAGVFRDDSQVVFATVYKRIAELDEVPGVKIAAADFQGGQHHGICAQSNRITGCRVT